MNYNTKNRISQWFNVPYGTWIWEHRNYLLLGALITLIPFSIRYVLYANTNYATGAYSDFTSFSIYLSDFVVLLLIVFNWKLLKNPPLTYLLAFIWIFGSILLNQTEYKNLEVYFSVRVIALLLLSLIISKFEFTSRIKQIFSLLFVILGVLQSIIALAQFAIQKSIGLYRLGESHLDPITYGVAKIVPYGTKMIRGYGTFPHPNLLSAFLLVSILLNLYLLTKDYQKTTRYVLYGTLSINIFGLFITFSRAGLLALGVTLSIFFLFLVLNKRYINLKRGVSGSILTILAAILVLSPYLATRTTISDNAVKERAFYNKIGTKIIENNPITGVGLGISVLHMEHYSQTDLEPWEIQPIHNFFLISMAEWGIGVIIFLLITLRPLVVRLVQIPRDMKFHVKHSTWNLAIFSIFCGIMVLFLFDHYFYTIWPTQLLLWLIVGLMYRSYVTR